MTYLKHTTTGDIYPFNADLAKRSDMVQCNHLGDESPPIEVLDDPGNAVPTMPRKKKPVVDLTNEFSSGTF